MPRAEFACQACGRSAGVVELAEADTPQGRQLRLSISGFLGDGWEAINPAAKADVESALAAGDAAALYRCARLWAPFYCADCDACYCREEWVISPQFDDDMPGFYDCSYGTCPHGHRRMVDD
jgi:hypothetical protein